MAGTGPPTPVLAAALADPAGCSAAGGFPAAPAAELAAPLEDPFFTILVAVARRRLSSLGASSGSGNGEKEEAEIVKQKGRIGTPVTAVYKVVFWRQMMCDC